MHATGNMKLSIITVNLNNCNGLRRTIDSVVSQTFTDFEWVVIDGGSTDCSRELIEQYKDHFAYWCSEPDNGIYNAMNKGIVHANGEWLLFLNSGDWLAEKNVLSEVFNSPISGDIIYGNIYQICDGKIIPIKYSPDLSFSTLFFTTIAHQSAFIRKELLFEKKYDEHFRIVSDWKFFIECSLNRCVFTHKDIFVSYYDDNGVSSLNRDLVLNERAEAINQLVPKCIQKDMYDFTEMKRIFADGQLLEINTIRNKNRFLHRLATLNLYILRFFYKLTVRK